jgi:hypothetical protein
MSENEQPPCKNLLYRAANISDAAWNNYRANGHARVARENAERAVQNFNDGKIIRGVLRTVWSVANAGAAEEAREIRDSQIRDAIE